MLVPKPKKAFQSPGVNSFGLNPIVDVVDVIARSPPWQKPFLQTEPQLTPNIAVSATGDFQSETAPPPDGKSCNLPDCESALARDMPNDTAVPIAASAMAKAMKALSNLI
jgi:hypothetical protein